MVGWWILECNKSLVLNEFYIEMILCSWIYDFGFLERMEVWKYEFENYCVIDDI